jgi:hypothetical protein
VIGMQTRSIPATPESTAKEEAFSQLRLPLMRTENRRGLLLANSPAADAVRRSVVRRLAAGDIQVVAERIDRGVAYVYNQTAGESALTVDVLLASLVSMTRDEARHVVQHIAQPFGLFVIPDPSQGEDSRP